jgi:rod shape determining protein RodA
MLLILEEPDLGTCLVFPPLAVAMLYWRGLSPVLLFLLVSPAVSAVTAFLYPPILGEPDWIHMLPWATLMAAVTALAIFSGMGLGRAIIALASNIAAGLVTPYLWYGLKDYQKLRILTFIQPEQDPLGAGYQIIQSKVAIGSGGVWGKGFLQGTQSKLDFLPERHTDFIFAVLGEELGLVGAAVVLGIYFFIIVKALQFAREARYPFASLVAFGIGTVFTFHVIVNVGMAAGMMPVTGLTLPLLSYGGTSVAMSMGMVGLLVGIGMRRRER